MTTPQQLAADYLSIMDVPGLYLVGSVALDDYRPGQSDVDFVAVTDEPVDPDRVRRAHAELIRRHRRPHFDGVYVTWSELAADPRKIDPGINVHAGKIHTEGREVPVTWHTLAQCGVAVRGPAVADLDIWTDETALAESVRENLDTYWRRWRREASRVSLRAAATLIDWGPVWVVLGVSRLHYTLATGKITSKTGAGLYARETFGPEWRRIIDECLRIRRAEPGTSLYRSRLARRRDALAFLDHVIADA